MTHLKLHTFASKRVNKKLMPDFSKEESDPTKRRYHFGIDLDNIDKNGKSFRQRINTLSKLNTFNTNKTHKQMQKKGLKIGRAFPPFYDWCRISTGTLEEVQLFSNSLISLY